MSLGIVRTIGQKCKRCYSCIRECPARAIRVINGQAVVIEERCISCGHCVKVCALQAKRVKSDIDIVLNEYLTEGNAIAIVAPSFPASFPENYQKIPTALRLLGFKRVTETAFGADLISKHYAELFENRKDETIISSACPAVYNFIEKYHVEALPYLAKVVSPMIAMGRYLKKNYGEETKVVFIGPCIAKKSEYKDDEVQDAIDAVLTFVELKEILKNLKVDLGKLQDSEFDPPHAFIGKTYPLTGGLCKTANIPSDLLEQKIIIAEGKNRVVEVIEEISEQKLQSKFVDLLFCEGCINGPAIDSELNYYSKREKVVDFINENINAFDKRVWKSNLYNSRELNLKREFRDKNQRRPMPTEEEIKEILARTNKFEKSDELNCGSCGYPSCHEYAVAIAKGLAEDDMCLPFLIEKLEHAYKELKETQEQLHHAEKLASIGQLAAGVAHEINNPLGSIMLYASMLKRKFEKAACEPQTAEDLKLIIDEANRCKNIVSNLLNFARQGKLKLGNVSLAAIINDIVKTMKMNPEFSGVRFTVNDETQSTEIQADVDQIKQVFINLIQNACEALEQSDIKIVSINLVKDKETIITEIMDTGCGIPPENVSKIFTPFFTTKKIGKGTGLGLAIAYGIVKMHKGDIKVKSTHEKGTVISVQLPEKQFFSNMVMN